MAREAVFIMDAHYSNVGSGESVNCKGTGNDIHIVLAESADEKDECLGGLDHTRIEEQRKRRQMGVAWRVRRRFGAKASRGGDGCCDGCCDDRAGDAMCEATDQRVLRLKNCQTSAEVLSSLIGGSEPGSTRPPGHPCVPPSME